ncbi:MAG TPA: excinuclease ABC subunit UvrC, partial [Dissulfurispiraceae bacterium]|nr:excinuclease ABC subunit UvrC [Dissulfurispiraceae bacterium]
RDDKNYPYIKLTTTEAWPRLEVVRGIKRDGNLYFGPYIPAQAMWEALAFIRRNFPIRPCNYALDKKMRPCIQYDMKKCPAPCAGKITKEEYLNIVEDVKLFLSGEKKGLLKNLEHKMQAYSEQMRYEEAARVRDSIGRLQRAFESQKVIAPELGDVDITGFCREGDIAVINILFLRKGILIGAKDFLLEKVAELKEQDIMSSVIELFYAKDIIPPPLILAGVLPAGREALESWLRDKRGGSVAIEMPRRGKKRDLLKMADENARLHLVSRIRTPRDNSMQKLREKLQLTQTPLSIGAFDVSTIQGSESVGAFVFWEHGSFKKGLFRHLRIKETEGVDDYAMMKEIVLRTLKNLGEKAPDLIAVDGGKAQLDVAHRALEELGIVKDIVGIAKKPDRAFLLNGGIVDLEDKDKSSLLLKKIRDEVHRFAISFHRKLRDKKLMDSPLTRIPGIGSKRRIELLRHFGSLDGIRSATTEDILNIKGFNRKIAERLKEELKQ